MKYRIYLEETPDIEPGWYTAEGRSNCFIYGRSDNPKDAVLYDLMNAEACIAEMEGLGYPCTLYREDGKLML